MKLKKISAIILVVLGIVLISLGIYYYIRLNKKITISIDEEVNWIKLHSVDNIEYQIKDKEVIKEFINDFSGKTFKFSEDYSDTLFPFHYIVLMREDGTSIAVYQFVGADEILIDENLYKADTATKLNLLYENGELLKEENEE